MRSYRIHEEKRFRFVRHVLQPFVICLGFAAGFFGFAFLTEEPAPRPDSIQWMSSEDRIGCTAFSVNDNKHLFATAFHCVFDEEGMERPHLKLAGLPFVPVKFDPEHDMILVRAMGSAPALRLAPRAPAIGDRVSASGHAMRSPQRLTFWGHLSHPSYTFLRDMDLGVKAVFDMELMAGISGAPILNQYGEVVSMAQGLFVPEPVGRAAWGPRYETLRDFVGEDWQ